MADSIGKGRGKLRFSVLVMVSVEMSRGGWLVTLVLLRLGELIRAFLDGLMVPFRKHLGDDLFLPQREHKVGHRSLVIRVISDLVAFDRPFATLKALRKQYRLCHRYVRVVFPILVPFALEDGLSKDKLLLDTQDEHFFLLLLFHHLLHLVGAQVRHILALNQPLTSIMDVVVVML